MVIMVSAPQLEESWSFGSLVTVSVGCVAGGATTAADEIRRAEGVARVTLMVPAPLIPSIT
jgi:hypothetical protein